MARSKPAFSVRRETRFPDGSSQYVVERSSEPSATYYQCRNSDGQLEDSIHNLSALERRCIRAAIERWMREWGQL